MKKQIFLPVILMVILVAACALPFGDGSSGVDQNAIETALAQIMLTENAASSATALAMPPITETPKAEDTSTTTPEPSATETNTPEPLSPTATFTQTRTPTATYTATSLVPRIHATVDTNCRYGPATSYAVLGYLMVSDPPVEVRGRLQAGGWWYIQNPQYPAASCWVWGGSTVVEGETSSLPFVTPPATQTPTPLSGPLASGSVNPSTYTGTCPSSFTLTGVITAAVPGSITYLWENHAGGTTTPATLTFAAAGSQTVTYTSPFATTTTGWFRLHITAPVSVYSSQIPFTFTCTP